MADINLADYSIKDLLRLHRNDKITNEQLQAELDRRGKDGASYTQANQMTRPFDFEKVLFLKNYRNHVAGREAQQRMERIRKSIERLNEFMLTDTTRKLGVAP